MATKKPLTNRTDFIKQRMSSAAADFQAADEVRTKTMDIYIAKTNKDRITVDESLLDDAPSEWNKFPQLPPDKMLQLKMSIMSVGILTPVILWEKGNGRYMILAGHNRVRAVRQILEEYKGLEHSFDYAKVPAIVYGKDEITEKKALEIIIDTNYIQRGDMEPRLRVSTIRARAFLLKEQKDERGATIDQIIKDLDLNKTTVYEDLQIGTQIIQPLQDLYYDGEISRRAVLKFAMYTEDIQQWIYDNFRDRITSARVCQLTKKMRLKDQIREVFEDNAEEVPRVHTQVTVPKNRLKDFRDFCTFYLDDPEFAKMCHEYIANRTGGNSDGN